MFAQRTIRSEKAITPILATLLLVVIAVAAIVVTYAWVMMYMGNVTTHAGEDLTIENVAFIGNNNIDVTVRSKGTSDSKIVAIYFGTSSSSLSPATTISPALPKLIPASSSQTFNITQSYTNGTRYYFKVVTESGYTLPYNDQP